MATDIQIQIRNNINNEKEVTTIHPLSELSFKFTLPKYVLTGNFTSYNLDREVDSDYEDTFKIDQTLEKKLKEEREKGSCDDITFYSNNFLK